MLLFDVLAIMDSVGALLGVLGAGILRAGNENLGLGFGSTESYSSGFRSFPRGPGVEAAVAA